MQTSLTLIISIVALLAILLCITLFRRLRALGGIQKEKEDILSEEKRMFGFLHHLGEATEKYISLELLYKEIVEGIIDVLRADGTAIYMLTEDGKHLIPKYISPQCPPLVGVPMEILRRAKNDSRVLESHLRLQRVDAHQGLLASALHSGKCKHIPVVKDHASFHDSFISYNEDISAIIAPLQHSGKDLGVLATVRYHKNGTFSANDYDVFKSVSEQSSFAIGNSLIHEELLEKRKLDTELRNAQEVQNILLPYSEPNIAGYRVCGSNTPARIISGDYYDYIFLSETHTGFVIADVTGKGVPAGLLMAMCRSVLRVVANESLSPSKTLSKVNKHLFPDVREDMFVSLVYLILENKTGNITLARAGHDAPLIFRNSSGEIENIKPPGLALGIDEGAVFERVTKDYSFHMHSGDCLLLHTDGVREALNAHDEEFGSERFEKVLREKAPMGAEIIVSSIKDAVKAFSAGIAQADDITLIALEKI